MKLAEKAIDAMDNEIKVKNTIANKLSNEVDYHLSTETDLRIALNNSNKELKKTTEFIVCLQSILNSLKNDIKTRENVENKLLYINYILEKILTHIKIVKKY